MLRMPPDGATEFDGIRFLANREMIEIVRHCDVTKPQRKPEVTPRSPKAAEVTSSPDETKKDRRRSVQFKFDDDDDLDLGQMSIRKTPLPPISSGSESSSEQHPLHKVQSESSANEIIDIIERANQRKRSKSFNFLTSQQRKDTTSSPRKLSLTSSPRKDTASNSPQKLEKSPRGKVSPRKRSKSLHNTLASRSLTIIKEDSKLAPHTAKSDDVTGVRRPRANTVEEVDDDEDADPLPVLRWSRTMSHDRMTYRRPSQRNAASELAPVAVRRKSKPLASIDVDRLNASEDQISFIKSALSPAPCPISPEAVRRRSLAQQNEVAQMLARVAQEKREEDERALAAAERRASALHPTADLDLMQEVNEAARDMKAKFPTADIVVRTGRNELLPVVEKRKTYDVNWGDVVD